MDQNTAQLIEKFRRNPAMAQSLLQSGDGQKLMQMLTRQDGGAALNRAAQSAAMGNNQGARGNALEPDAEPRGHGGDEPHQREREKISETEGRPHERAGRQTQ